jgi:FkbM family methyltransferase
MSKEMDGAFCLALGRYWSTVNGMNFSKRNIIKALSILANNPRLFFKLLIGVLGYRVWARYFLPKSPIQKKIKGVLFRFDFYLYPKTKEMYFGFYETELTDVMQVILKPGDIFIDIGAHIGYISAIGAGLVGKTGQVHSFEPVPECFEELRKFAMLNPDYKIILNQCALGEKEGIKDIYVTNIQEGWNTMLSDLMKNEIIKKRLKVPICRLDSYIKQKALNNISLIKIDVEAFEFPVLKGLSNYFENTGHLPAIICEIHPLAFPLLGYTPAQMLEYMSRYGYRPYSPFDIRTEIDITKLEHIVNVVFIRLRKKPHL